MISVSPLVDELAELLDASCLDELTPTQELRLRDLVCSGDSECRIHYVLFMHMHAMIERREGQAGRHASEVLETHDEGMTEAVSPPFVPLSALPGAAIHGAFGYLSSGWPLAYLVALVIFGVGVVVGTMVHVAAPVQVANQSPSVPSGLLLPEYKREMAFVGRITGMIDCQWADPQTEAFNGANVPLGRKYALKSGLMEISYNTGAKVILQGPVTYEVESATGGYLSIGKLTARVEKKAESEKRKAKSGLSTLHSPLFSVRTPTATVTDLGTEFGVEVSQEGLIKTAVFDGKVVVTVAATSGQPASDLYLKAGEAVQVMSNVTQRIEWGDATKQFVRTICTQPAIPPVPPLMVTDQLSLWLKADAGITTGDGNCVTAWADQSGQGHHATTNVGVPKLHPRVIHGRPAVHFHGSDGLLVSGQVLTSQQFTIIAVVSDTGPFDGFREIFSNWSDDNRDDSVFLGTNTGDARSNRNVRFTDNFTPLRPFSTSHHTVLTGVSESSDARVLVNEACIAAKGARLTDRNLSTTSHVGYQGTAECLKGTFEFWYGDIAELLVYNKALSAAELDRVHAYLNVKYEIQSIELPGNGSSKGPKGGKEQQLPSN